MHSTQYLCNWTALSSFRIPLFFQGLSAVLLVSLSSSLITSLRRQHTCIMLFITDFLQRPQKFLFQRLRNKSCLLKLSPRSSPSFHILPLIHQHERHGQYLTATAGHWTASPLFVCMLCFWVWDGGSLGLVRKKTKRKILGAALCHWWKLPESKRLSESKSSFRTHLGYLQWSSEDGLICMFRWEGYQCFCFLRMVGACFCPVLFCPSFNHIHKLPCCAQSDRLPLVLSSYSND